jgi:biopolymer transport protein ExbB/TolQ
MGNAYYSFVNIENYKGWIELFGLVDSELLVQKRILAILQGAILPFIALGYIHVMTDIFLSKKTEEDNKNLKQEELIEEILNRIDDKDKYLKTEKEIDVIKNIKKIDNKSEKITDIKEESKEEIKKTNSIEEEQDLQLPPQQKKRK